MRRIEKINQTTKNRFLNMYTLEMKSDTGKESTYYVASRAKNIDELKSQRKKIRRMVLSFIVCIRMKMTVKKK